MKFSDLTKEQLEELYTETKAKYEAYKAEGMSLNIARGKPAPDQLDMSMPMLDCLTSKDMCLSDDGTDCRNYGVFDGLPEMKQMFADILGVKPENVVIFGNSSLNVMFDIISRHFTHGLAGCTPWCKLDKVKFLCPVPGYDRHFGVTEYFGVEMIPVPMNDEGPDMDLVEKYVNEDDSVKGMWCIPVYSNPGGVVYSDATVRRLAALKPAAKDFRIFWDNAYVVHHLYDEGQAQILEIISECEKAGNPDLVYEFTSTSKISFPGAGVSAVASSPANVKEIKTRLACQTIGHDKLNQLRHIRFFKNADGIRAYMSEHAKLLRPKFEATLEILERELAELEIATWTKPRGGYFVSFDSMEGCAKRIVGLCKEAGMVLTGAGATFPYKKDPQDRNIRIAPSFPTVPEITKAMELFCVCVKLATLEKLLNK